jgi:hypothetical protein
MAVNDKVQKSYLLGIHENDYVQKSYILVICENG